MTASKHSSTPKRSRKVLPWHKHRDRVLKKHPNARECIAWRTASGSLDKVYIVIGLNTVIGEGRYGSIAWANAAGKL